MTYADVQIALDANRFTRFAAEFPEADTKRARITVGTAQDLAGFEEKKEAAYEQYAENEEARATGN